MVVTKPALKPQALALILVVKVLASTVALAMQVVPPIGLFTLMVYT